ncbi:cobalamin biosynthesis protein [Nocardioides hwasunensis]|uniref:Cobalamin biosynthesis protein CobD n=1 Tax=Nocardioides hwasunensis TaxID=397258 RepID=A0ABR8MKF6_9ACTN|nr:cobalamin biosynthesis protein [Nocardioides hwasunensis]MBD3916513.1 cobalamin biosynthesis protein [Nocardioides hwasunensis]
MSTPAVSRALGLALGHLADRRLGDPQRGHPVALFGSAAAALERRTYADSRPRGVGHLALLAGTVSGGGLVLERRTRDHFVAHTLLTAAATWTVLGGTSLAREAAAVHGLLAADDLPGARQRLTHLVGRDTSVLDAEEVSRATVESVAENTSDAVVAPLVWGGLLGVPGLLGYRAVNTLDAMVGHLGERYGRFGWASARLDDLLNLPGARLSGLLAAALAPRVGGRPRDALRAWARDARRHPSPNAGVVEAAFAGALGVRLGGRNTYAHGTEDRVLLGDGPPPGPDDIDRSVRLADQVGAGAVVVAVLLALRRRA